MSAQRLRQRAEVKKTVFSQTHCGSQKMGNQQKGSPRRSSPTQVLSSSPSCSPGDGQRQRISPWTSSQPYWQWAREQVLESEHIGSNTKKIERKSIACASMASCSLEDDVTHWCRSRQASRRTRSDSSICNFHSCSCSGAHRDEVSGRTRSDLGTIETS